jgi:hypothetical protein
MKRRNLFVFVAVAVVLSGSTATLGWLASGYKNGAVVSNGQPTWTEVAWPFAPDEWGKGKAFRCTASNCGTEINLYVRAKLGFCNCTTGIADDADLDRMGDLHLVGGQTSALGAGRPIIVGHMLGRSRAYALTGRSPLGRTAVSAAFNDRCDMVVATVVVAHDRPHAIEQEVIQFLNSTTVMRWAEVTLGL